MSYSYTLPVPATPAQIYALAATIAREVPDRSRRVQLKFGTCTLLSPDDESDTVTAAYALATLYSAAQPANGGRAEPTPTATAVPRTFAGDSEHVQK